MLVKDFGEFRSYILHLNIHIFDLSILLPTEVLIHTGLFVKEYS